MIMSSRMAAKPDKVVVTDAPVDQANPQQWEEDGTDDRVEFIEFKGEWQARRQGT